MFSKSDGTKPMHRGMTAALMAITPLVNSWFLSKSLRFFVTVFVVTVVVVSVLILWSLVLAATVKKKKEKCINTDGGWNCHRPFLSFFLSFNLQSTHTASNHSERQEHTSVAVDYMSFNNMSVWEGKHKCVSARRGRCRPHIISRKGEIFWVWFKPTRFYAATSCKADTDHTVAVEMVVFRWARVACVWLCVRVHALMMQVVHRGAVELQAVSQQNDQFPSKKGSCLKKKK